MKKPTVWFILSILLIKAGQAQPEHLNFTSLGLKDGLFSNSINVILKDHQGLLWFATNDGLDKFDGTNFTVYRHKRGDSTSLSSNEVLTLYEDPAGDLWIGTGGGALDRYDRNKDVFINYPRKDTDTGLTRTALIRGICGDGLGKIWLAQYQAPYILDPSTGALTKLDLARYAAPSASRPSLTCVFRDSRRRMWVGTDHGLFLYQPETNSFRQYRHSASDPAGLIDNNVRTMAEDKQGNLWIGTDTGLCKMKPSAESFVAYRQMTHGDSILGRGAVTAISVDHDGLLWIGTMHGLHILDPQTGRASVYTHDAGDPHSLSSTSISCIHIDNQGIYWIGTYWGGVNKYDRNLNLFDVKLGNAFEGCTAENVNVTSFAMRRDGNVFVGTDGPGLYVFDTRTEKLRHIPLDLDGRPAKTLSILALERTTGNKLYIGTYRKGVVILDPATGKTRHLARGPGMHDLDANDIFCITELSTGDIWVGTNGAGIDILRAGKVVARLTPYPQSPIDSPLPVNGYIRAICEDADGRIWIGTYGSGIAVYDPHTRHFTLYTQDNGSLLSNKILALTLDSKQRMWVGSYAGGLSRFDKGSDRFIHYTEKEGLQNSTIYQIVEDTAGIIWLSTNTGLSSLDVQSGRFRNFTTYNGLQANSFTRQTGIRLPDGRLLFGGLEGFNYFNPGELTTNRNVPPVMLTDLKVANQSVMPGKQSPVREQIAVAKEIDLNYKQNFALSFVALNYTIPNENRYAYKLDGFDTGWNDVGTRNTAYYTNLDPGEYTFHVKAGNNDGLWSTKDTSIRIVVHPPLWRTTYAYIFYVLAVGGLLFYSRHRGLARMRKRFALEQERREIRRMQELDRLKLKFLTNLSHEFRTPVSLIMGPVDQLLDTNRDRRSQERLQLVKRNARRLLNLVNQLLDFRKMEEQELKLQLTEGEFAGFVGEVCASFADLAERKRIGLSFETRLSGLYAFFDRDKIERILFNLLSNAFKFTMEGGAVTVSLEEDPTMPATLPDGGDDATVAAGAAGLRWVVVKVADTGIGIPGDKLERIFDRFFQHSATGEVLNQGTGIGLSITREFVALHGGTIAVESSSGQGSTFTIRLPLTLSHQPLVVATATNALASTAAEYDPLPDAAAQTPTGAIAEGENETKKTVILLVEDNEDFRFYLKDNLRTHYKVLEAANGKDGWQKALSGHPSLIVSDISMPYMDGIILTRKLKADKRTNHIPVILLTALAQGHEQLAGLATGANDYITKPFSFELLQVKIKNLLQLSAVLKTTYVKQVNITAAEPEIEPADVSLLKKVVACLEENLDDPRLSVEFISKELGMSRTTLYSKLLELTGETPVEYIRTFKLAKAAKLLEKSDLTIAEIAYRTGFSKPNYFARVFKMKYDALPSEYAAKCRKEQRNNQL